MPQTKNNFHLYLQKSLRLFVCHISLILLQNPALLNQLDLTATLLNTIGDAILRLNRELNYTFCMIEHDIEFISRLCDPVIVMAEVSVLMTDTISDDVHLHVFRLRLERKAFCLHSIS